MITVIYLYVYYMNIVTLMNWDMIDAISKYIYIRCPISLSLSLCMMILHGIQWSVAGEITVS